MELQEVELQNRKVEQLDKLIILGEHMLSLMAMQVKSMNPYDNKTHELVHEILDNYRNKYPFNSPYEEKEK